MKNIEKIRRIAVISFIVIGLLLGIYSKSLPKYKGIGNGFAGDIIVSVGIRGDKIKEIKVIEHSETLGISDKAILEMPGKILKIKTIEEIESIEGVAGATYTSEGIKEAVLDAISK